MQKETLGRAPERSEAAAAAAAAAAGAAATEAVAARPARKAAKGLQLEEKREVWGLTSCIYTRSI